MLIQITDSSCLIFLESIHPIKKRIRMIPTHLSWLPLALKA